MFSPCGIQEAASAEKIFEVVRMYLEVLGQLLWRATPGICRISRHLKRWRMFPVTSRLYACNGEGCGEQLDCDG